MEVERDHVASKWEDIFCPIRMETENNTCLNIFHHGEEFQVRHFRCPFCREDILSIEALESDAQLLLKKYNRPCPHGCDFMGSFQDIDDYVATMHSLRNFDFDAQRLHDIEHYSQHIVDNP